MQHCVKPDFSFASYAAYNAVRQKSQLPGAFAIAEFRLRDPLSLALELWNSWQVQNIRFWLHELHSITTARLATEQDQIPVRQTGVNPLWNHCPQIQEHTNAQCCTKHSHLVYNGRRQRSVIPSFSEFYVYEQGRVTWVLEASTISDWRTFELQGQKAWRKRMCFTPL